MVTFCIIKWNMNIYMYLFICSRIQQDKPKFNEISIYWVVGKEVKKDRRNDGEGSFWVCTHTHTHTHNSNFWNYVNVSHTKNKRKYINKDGENSKNDIWTKTNLTIFQMNNDHRREEKALTQEIFNILNFQQISLN